VRDTVSSLFDLTDVGKVRLDGVAIAYAGFCGVKIERCDLGSHSSSIALRIVRTVLREERSSKAPALADCSILFTY